MIVDETDSESERVTAVGSLGHWKNCAGEEQEGTVGKLGAWRDKMQSA